LDTTIEAMGLTSNTHVLEIHEEDMLEEEITSDELHIVKYLQQEYGTKSHSLSVEI
jgi:hypothetical protein